MRKEQCNQIPCKDKGTERCWAKEIGTNKELACYGTPYCKEHLEKHTLINHTK